jgi:hypothetical protein
MSLHTSTIRPRPRRFSAIVPAAVAALATCSLALATADAASASIPGLQQVSKSTAFNSDKTKTTTVVCPSGTKLISAGGHIGGATGDVVLDQVTPNPTMTFADVTAYETRFGSSKNWMLTPTAQCAQAVPGQTRAIAVSKQDSNQLKAVTVSGPLGTRVIGTGYDISGGNGRVLMDHVRPDSQLTSVIISASEDNGNITTPWALSGFATALPGLERIVATDTTQDALGGFSATARCSFDRKRRRRTRRRARRRRRGWA